MSLAPGIRHIAAIAAVLASTAAPAFPQGARRFGVESAQRGVVIARTYCMKCHSIDKVSPSPLTIAPPFRDLHRKYPVERLEESLAEGVVTGHPTMPEFRFDADQIGDFIAFLNTLK